MSALIFTSLTIGKLFLKYPNPRPVLSITFTNVFLRPSFMCKGGKKMFPGITIGGLTKFLSRGVNDVRLGHSLFTQWFFLSWLSHSHKKQQCFVCTICIPSNSATTFRSPHNFHLTSSYLNFPKCSFMLSKLSFLLAAWAKGTDGNLWRLWSRTSFKLTFDDSMNKRLWSGINSWPRNSITEQTSLQNTTPSPWVKKSLNYL